MLILARGVTTGYLALGIILLDTFCLGIKDAIFGHMAGPEFDALRDRMAAGIPLKPVEPSYARKLLRELAGWAQANGFAPARDFTEVERLFGDVSAEACDTTFQFGYEGGKPLYIGDLSDWTALRRRVA
jgi:hypothetical protein